MISFLQPLALLGLLGAAIPPLLHLISRRVPPLITFPSVRYLTETERKHSRRLRLRHLLLLLLRTALIVLIAFAASRPVARLPFGDSHEPSDIVVVLDNSLSSGAVVDGRRVLDELIERVHHVLDRTSSGDRLWLMLADGVPHRLSVPEARAVVDTITAWPIRLDLSEATRIASQVMQDRPTAFAREVLVISDLQASAFGTAESLDNTRVLLWGDAPHLEVNRSIDSAWSDPTIWSPEGRVIGVIGGSTTAPATVSLTSDARALGRGFGGAGDRVVLPGSAQPGWHVAVLDLDPDELRADDRRFLALLATPAANVNLGSGAGVFVGEVVAALRTAGRVGNGPIVTIGDTPGRGTTVVMPPADQAMVGTINRELAGHGVTWQFGDVHQGEWRVVGDSVAANDVTVTRRRQLRGSGGTVLLSVGNEPWAVKERDVVILASRLEPGWTTLPLTAGFAPFVDWLINRVAARQVTVVSAAPGASVQLPGGVETVLGADGVEMTTGDGRIVAPQRSGVYFLRAASGDTVGALQVNPDPRESRLDIIDARDVTAAIGEGAEVLDSNAIDRELFSGAQRADLTGALVLVAIAVALVELFVATVGGGRSTEG